MTARHDIERLRVDSSNLAAIGYEDGICVVEFHNGHIYAYEMTPEQFAVFATSESRGRYFNQEIRGKFVGDKLTGLCTGCGSVEVIAKPCAGCGGVVRAIDRTHKEER